MSCASPSKNPLPIPDRGRGWKRFAVGSYRLGIVGAAFACLYFLPDKPAEPDRGKILSEARTVLPTVADLGQPEDGLLPLLNQSGETIGWAATTFPEARNIQGYSGPSELLVIFDAGRKVKSVSLLASADTAGHVAKIRGDAAFWDQWTGKTESMLGTAPAPRIVTGASLTSEAMARGIAARFGAEGMEQWFRKELSPADVSRWFPAATRVEKIKGTGTYRIFKNDELLGTVLRSSRMGVSARGFNGTSDVIVCLDPGGVKILGVGLLASRDNEPYGGDVKEELKYADGFAGKTIAEVSDDDSPLLVSGASVTAGAVIDSVTEMLRRHQADRAPQPFPWRQVMALSWIALGLVIGLAKWGGRPRVRLAFAVLSVVAGVTLGWMVSQDQLIGWAKNGLDSRAALPLLALTAVALVVPAYTGRNVYCNRICPHGAAQTLLGQIVKRRLALPPKLHHFMRRVPWLTLLAIWVLALFSVGFPFSHLEPFETWSSGFQAILPAAIFSIGLLAAAFLPQGYCHYGCPTGALLRFLTHSPGRWTSKDTAALVLVAIAGGFVMFR